MDVFDLSFSYNSFIIRDEERKEGKGKQSLFFLFK